MKRKIACKWQLSYAPHYIFDKDGNCYNSKTGKKLKMCYVSRCIGYNINGKFKSLSFISKHLEKIQGKETLPF